MAAPFFYAQFPCRSRALLPDPTTPRVSDVAMLAEAMRDVSRWRIDPFEERARRRQLDGVPTGR
ncbi:MAG: hypothetical protein P9C36_13990 [Defluviicoccus sp.]|nr:hypothetical protein [Defluviicoccus sp.]MDG4593728.1 hypothetical protein [Defluviicoccus sp.]